MATCGFVWQIDMIDRSISLMAVKKSRLQLLGCACLLIASKYEEIHPPTVEELAYISDDTYTNRQILKVLCIIVLWTFVGQVLVCLSHARICHTDGKTGFEHTLL